MNKWMIAIFLLCLAGMAAPFLRQQDAQYYFDRGSRTLASANPNIDWFYHWNINGALADFSHAIRLNPKFVAAYSSRAGIKIMNRDFAGAIQDYTTVIQLEPQDEYHYLARASAELAEQDFQRALADYDQVIKLNPDNRAAYRGRINVKESQHDFTGMVIEQVRMTEEISTPFFGRGLTNRFFSRRSTSTNRPAFSGGFRLDRFGRLSTQLNRALESDTNFAWGYYYRGVIRSLTNDLTGALNDFQKCQNFSDVRLKDYAAIYRWLLEAHYGNKETANRELHRYCQTRTDNDTNVWQLRIAQFLLGEISATEFSAAIEPSNTEREQNEFWYYTGMKHLLAGDKQAAVNCFRKSLATTKRTYAAYISATSQLRALDTVVMTQ